MEKETYVLSDKMVKMSELEERQTRVTVIFNGPDGEKRYEGIALYGVVIMDKHPETGIPFEPGKTAVFSIACGAANADTRICALDCITKSLIPQIEKNLIMSLLGIEKK